MFASFVAFSFFSVAHADGSAVEDRLMTLSSPQIEKAALFDGERRRNDLSDALTDDATALTDEALRDGVRSMAVQAGFRFKDCVEEAPFGGMMKRFTVMFAPTILGVLMDFEVNVDRRRWGFNRNNFIANIAEPLEGVSCENLYFQCQIKAMRVFQQGMEENQADVQARYPFTAGSMDSLVSCAIEEIPDICADYKYLVCPESEGN